MWIDSIEIKGFGCLVNRHYEFPRDKVVLIIDENEQGKSTLVAAILASLCGLPTRRSSKNAVRPIDVYKPWFGESYCVKLHFEATGLRYCVERDFDRNTFVVRDVYTNVDVSGSFPVDLASHFLRLPRDDYERIAVISGKEVSRFDSSPTIRERLTAVVEGSENSVGAEVALDRLRSAVYRLEGADIKPDTAIRRIQEQIDQRERRLHELDKKLEEADENVQLLYKLRKRRKELEERVSELNSEYGLSRLSEISERIAVAEQDRQKHSELLEELKSLEHYATFPVERRDQLYKAVARLQQFEDQIRDCEARERQLNAEADKIERQLNSYKSLAGASQDDLIRIRSTAESLSQARTSLDEARERFESVKRDWLSRLGKALVLLGSLSVLLSLVGLSVKAINLSPGMAVVAIGLAVIVAGLVLYLRRASVQTEVRAHLKQSERAFEQMAELAILHLRRLGVEADEQSDLVFVLNEIIDRLETYLKYSAN
ncbi:MAG: AAA family ATPase, partial [Armatimonadota bacterium]